MQAALVAVALVVAAAGAQTADERAADSLERAADAVGEERPDPPATARDIAVVCALAPRFHADQNVRRTNRPEVHYERLRQMAWRALPKSVTCGSRRVVLSPSGFGEFVTGIARSRDGRVVALRGGAQLAPLAGGGGECIYRRTAKGYELDVCVQTWVS